ncbi:MAG: hypothetical protein ACM3PP_01230 [Candidatus Saccharibacteria bacterium]
MVADLLINEECPMCTSMNIRNTGVGRLDGRSGVIWKYQCVDCAVEFLMTELEFIQRKSKLYTVPTDSHKTNIQDRFAVVTMDKFLKDVNSAKSGVVAWYTQFKDKVYQHQFRLADEIIIGQEEGKGQYIQYRSLKCFFDDRTTILKQKPLFSSSKVYRIESDKLLRIQMMLQF